jgi:orotate phosphoribosyltransferase
MSPIADVSWLFETSALKIAPAGSPFWYTSGLIGPYYINTQFLCGGADQAAGVLRLIDAEQDRHETFHLRMTAMLEQVHASHPVFHDFIDLMVASVASGFPAGDIDYVSGGQRRDWFFAPIVSQKLGKPMLYIYNDQTVRLADGSTPASLQGARVMNVADLLTVGSSYTKKWIPALSALGAELRWSLNGVDRLQGGVVNLTRAGVSRVHSLFSIDLSLFDQALARGCIDWAQYDMVRGYIADPFGSMRTFILEHPGFLDEARNSPDERTRMRAATLLKEDLYKL